MIEKKDIEHLAKLARIKLSDEEKDSLAKDIPNILNFVEQIQSASASRRRDGEVSGEEIEKDPSRRGEAEAEVGKLRNVMREDENPYEKGLYTEKLLEEAPEREENFVKVKKIL